jgi:hypothetical protein
MDKGVSSMQGVKPDFTTESGKFKQQFLSQITNVKTPGAEKCKEAATRAGLSPSLTQTPGDTAALGAGLRSLLNESNLPEGFESLELKNQYKPTTVKKPGSPKCHLSEAEINALYEKAGIKMGRDGHSSSVGTKTAFTSTKS